MKRNTKLFVLSLSVRICGLFRLTRTARATAYLNNIDTYINTLNAIAVFLACGGFISSLVFALLKSKEEKK